MERKFRSLVAVFAAAVSPAVFAAASIVPEEGPMLPLAEFFRKHVDTSLPGLGTIGPAMQHGRVAEAEKAFADYLRARFAKLKVNDSWIEGGKVAVPRSVERQAADIMERYRFSAAGCHHVFNSRRVDWVANPTVGRYSEWPWQLSRHEGPLCLCRMYAATKDEAYAKEWVRLLSSWLDQALFYPDPKHEVRKACWRTLDTAIRIPRWTRMIAAMCNSPSVSDHFLCRLARSLHEKGEHLRARPSSTGNWLVFEMQGLFNLAVVFDYDRSAKEWREYATRRLDEEYTGQVHPDGFQEETSEGYHHCVLSSYLQVLDVYRLVGEKPPDYILSSLERMFEVYPRLSRPDRRTPGLNDAGASGIYGCCGDAMKYFPGNATFRWFATRGREGTPPAYLSNAFEYAGYVTFRDSWAEDAVWGFLDCGDVWFHGWHSHEDALSFNLSAYGKNMLVDPGNYRYDTSEMRKYVTTTPSHNTVMIDGLGQCRKLWPRAKDYSVKWPAPFHFRTTAKVDYATAYYADGYGEKQVLDVCHRRSVFFFKGYRGLRPFFAVVDALKGSGAKKHSFDALWHLEESVLAIDGNRWTADFGDGVGLAAVSSDPAPFEDRKGRRNPYQGWLPIHDGDTAHEHRPIPTPVQHGEFASFKRFVTVFQPVRNGEKREIAAVTCDEKKDTGSFELVLADGSRLAFPLDKLPIDRFPKKGYIPAAEGYRGADR